MTDPNLSLVAALLDRSGSMQSIVDDTCGGFDAFIATERSADVETVVSLAQFDTEYEQVYTHRPIVDVPPLDLQPRGGTALLDAIGRFVTEIGTDLAARPEQDRPGAVTVLVMTDGMENSSREWTVDAVRALIRQQEEQYAWTFVFLGANMDAVDVGTSMGFSADRSLTYAAAPDQVRKAYHAVSNLQARGRESRRAGRPVEGFTTGERDSTAPR
ncbi:MAG: VWA domain-containing protein [Williamsia herbipolensis]|nr:VWA domain-containing protein [Williamsia herbipolensis]